ncbi:hypothetical protein WN944_022293 [Citrus x changshan-huyou]|uniref:Uncharacterized protein n=1 Tax=Citrus x changshan-huyou TaxID=2935761 RepID=A0AAP0N0Z9_9ROSI
MAALFNSSNKTIPCRSGKCTTPIDVTCFMLIISEVFPEFVAKVLLYPGALASAIMKGKSIPSYSKLLRLYNFTNLTNFRKIDLLRLEVLAGSYLSVAGALIGARRMSLIGTLLLLWGPVREAIMFRLIVENLWRNWNFLEKSCACHRVMPCLISYIWYDKVSYFVPFLEVCVAIELKEANPKPFQAGVL